MEGKMKELKKIDDIPARRLCRYIQKLEKEYNMNSYEVYGMMELAKQSF
jgi:hypothetical protein